MHRASSRVGGVVDAALELLLGDPFRQEIGGHEVVGDLDDAALAVGHAALQRVVAAQEVARARGGFGVVGDEDVCLVVREDDGRSGRRGAEGDEDLADSGPVL